MNLKKIASGTGFICLIGVLFFFDVVIILNWIDAIYPSTLTTELTGFWDGVMQVFMTTVFGIITYAVAEHYGEEY